MKHINRMTAYRQTRLGQSIYIAMLAISLVAVVVALVFPILEYVQLYRGPDESGADYAAPAPRRAPAPESAEPAAAASPEAPAPVEGDKAATPPAE